MAQKRYISSEQKRQNTRAVMDTLGYLVVKKDLTTKIGLDRTFWLDDISPAPGTWYFVTDCHRCGKPVPLVEDPSQSGLGNPYQGPGAFKVNCPHCRKPVSAIVSKIRPLLWDAPAD